MKLGADFLLTFKNSNEALLRIEHLLLDDLDLVNVLRFRLEIFNVESRVEVGSKFQLSVFNWKSRSTTTEKKAEEISKDPNNAYPRVKLRHFLNFKYI